MMATAIAPGSSPTSSSQPTLGTAGSGTAPSTAPMTSTPRAVRSAAATTAIPPTPTSRAAGDPLEAEQHGQAAQPDRDRPEVHVAEPARQVAGLGEEVALAGGHPEQLGQLADDDGQPQPEHEADLDPGGDEARHEPHPEQAEGDQDDPDQHGQEGREVGVAGGVAKGDRGHDRRRDGRRGRGRADDQLPAGAEQAVAEQPGEGGEQPGLGRQPGDLGVGDRLRHHQRPGGQGGDDVPAQPGPPVVPQPVERRHWRASRGPWPRPGDVRGRRSGRRRRRRRL